MKDALREGLRRFGAFFRRRPLDEEFNRELAAHLEFAVEENLRRGLAPEEARRQALVRLGGIEQTREQQRDARGLPWLDDLLQDLRHSVRSLSRARVFTLVAVLILALGIGANVAVFSVVDAVLLRPPPFSHPGRLVWIEGRDVSVGLSGETFPVSIAEEIQQYSHSLAGLTSYFAFYSPGSDVITRHGQRLPVTQLGVAGNFFSTLGVQPQLGRDFTPVEAQKGGPHAVLLSHAYWQSAFASDPAIVGQTIHVNDTGETVVGVLPASFDFGSVFAPGTRIDLFTPVRMDEIRNWGNTLSLIGRLKPGVTVGQARAELNGLMPRLHRLHPQEGKHDARLLALQQHVSGPLRRSLMVLWGAVGMILLIVCVNLSNLLISRSATRTREFAVRRALGAGRGRLLRQLLTESLVLAAAGAALGVALAWGLTRWLAHSGAIAIPLLRTVQVNGVALLWALAIALATAVLSGLAPALSAGDENLLRDLNEAGRGSSEGGSHRRLRSTLVISEVALACVLLIGAGLLLRSFVHLLDANIGFQPSRAAALKIDDSAQTGDQRGAALHQILDRVKSIPGIEAAGVTDSLPLGMNRSWGFWPKGKPMPKGTPDAAFVYVITPGYLRAMGMHLIEGRDLQWSDTEKSQAVVLIDQTTARRLWPGQDPIGRIGMIGDGSQARVVGVIADVRENKVESQTGLSIYLPVTQAGPMGAELVFRTRLPLAATASTILQALRSMNPNQPLSQVEPLQALVDHAVSPRRFLLWLVACFAGLGLLLAALGIYGVISYSVTRQTREIGIRMALGASAGRVQRQVVAGTLRLVLAGVAIGAVVSFALARLIASLLYSTSPTDPLTFAAVVALLTAVALLSGYLPALRASRISPMVALRTE